ncbi:MAG: hypothetical protein ACLUIX_08505 [Oscillospiraceae bacterium]
MAQLSEKRLFLLDMDGTIYLDERIFDGVPEFLSMSGVWEGGICSSPTTPPVAWRGT